jgi:hypothetical protein
MVYELWDAESANLIGTYPTEEAALAIVRYSVATYGVESIRYVGLGLVDELGYATRIAYGDELIELAERPGPAVRSA